MTIETHLLHNTIPLYLASAPGTPRVAVALAIAGGIARERVPGISRLAAALLLKGTARRDAGTLAREIDERAIGLGAQARADCLLVSATALNRELPVALDLLGDILRNSTFADFDRERKKMDGEIRASLDQPGDRAADLLSRTLYGAHPYGNTGVRVLESLPLLDDITVHAWYAAALAAGDISVVVVGDVTAADVLPALEAMLSGLPPREGDAPSEPIIREGDAPSEPLIPPLARTVRETRPEARQAQVYCGRFAPPVGDPAQAAMMVLNGVLGTGMSSRLFVELRDKRGLAYQVFSRYVPLRWVGRFVLGMGTSPENIEVALAGYDEQLRRLMDEPVGAVELRGALGHLDGLYVLGHETNGQCCLDMAVHAAAGLGPDYSPRLRARLAAVTPAEVRAAARALDTPAVIAIVEPPSLPATTAE